MLAKGPRVLREMLELAMMSSRLPKGKEVIAHLHRDLIASRRPHYK